MTADDRIYDPDTEWLRHVQPEGLVVAPMVLKALGPPPRQDQTHSVAVAALLPKNSDGSIMDEGPALADPWAFFGGILNWPADMVAGAPSGPPLDEKLEVSLPEHDTLLKPDWAVKAAAGADGFQLLVQIEKPGVDSDKRGALDGWEAAPIQRFERLLRETKVETGILVSDKDIRLVHAPRGETSGWIAWPIRPLATVAGRPMLGGLKLLLDAFRLFNDAEPSRLPALLKASRDAQAEVSTRLAEQVLGALHELLRGLTAADSARIANLCETRPDHLYEGLLTVLLRLVFALYAEDRNLLPSLQTEKARRVYEASYALRSLYAKLLEDQALNPDTMDERRGAWGQLIALFRLIHGGHGSGFIQKRGGKLFDPDAFPFLEGRDTVADTERVLSVSDGCVLRVLEGLMTIGGSKGQARERLSYRTLDVEQIGSVYEIVMGFRAETAGGPSLAIKAGKNNRTPVFVNLGALLAKKGKERLKFLKEEADRSSFGKAENAIETAATIAELVAALDDVADERASPGKRISAKGTPILQPTDERRRTGSHYTPRSLTEPIVRYALEPAFERLGPDARPENVFDLKVCDPAMGSGAFLVESCRALAARLVKAWARWPETKPRIPEDEDDDLHARRLVAQRCLYGVDKNPLAVDLAKLSLWLATLARAHEFTFLDHALKSGDSLVGLTQEQIAAAHWDTSKPGLPLFRQLVKQRVAEAMKGRAEIQVASDDTARSIQEARHRSLETRIEPIHIMGDAVIASFFFANKLKAREKKRQEAESLFSANVSPDWLKLGLIAKSLQHYKHPLMPFHWEIEFPEVFMRQNAGFDAIVGNPPFLGGTNISGTYGPAYKDWLNAATSHSQGKGDLCGHFFRRAFASLRTGGCFGLLATNTISQGATREMGLRIILRQHGKIIRAVPRLKWPGEAAVVPSVVHVLKEPSPFAALPKLRGVEVDRISAYLLKGSYDDSPFMLTENAGKAFTGTKIYGNGFTFDDADSKGLATSISEMNRIIEQDGNSRHIIRPYLGAEEVNTDPCHFHRRYVIDFGDMPLERDAGLPAWSSASKEERQAWLATGVVPDDYPLSTASDWPELLKIVEGNVRPERKRSKNAEVRQFPWWKYWRSRDELYGAIKSHSHCLVASAGASPHHTIARLSVGSVFSHALAIFAFSDFGSFAILQSRVHEIWARVFSSSMKDDLRYTPSDAFSTSPFPKSFESNATLASIGKSYHDHRAALMIACKEGLTKTYNRFHDRNAAAQDIGRLRELHAGMDRAVLEAYGWHDLAPRAEPIFLDESNEDDHTYQGRLFWPSDFRDEVLARLIALNGERHAEEVRLGVAPGMKGKQSEDEDDDELEEV